MLLIITLHFLNLLQENLSNDKRYHVRGKQLRLHKFCNYKFVTTETYNNRNIGHKYCETSEADHFYSLSFY